MRTIPASGRSLSHGYQLVNSDSLPHRTDKSFAAQDEIETLIVGNCENHAEHLESRVVTQITRSRFWISGVCLFAAALSLCLVVGAATLSFQSLPRDDCLTQNVVAQVVEGSEYGPLHVLTFATRVTEGFCRLLVSAAYAKLHASVPITVLGYDPSEPEERKSGWKYLAMYDYLRALPSDTIVAFVDAYDVVVNHFVGGPDEIVRRFLKLGAPIVFSAEIGCWPWSMTRSNGAELCQRYLPPVSSRSRYLNSGTWIGHSSVFLAALRSIIERHTQDGQEPSPIVLTSLDDQEVMTELLVCDYWLRIYANEGEVRTLARLRPSFENTNDRSLAAALARISRPDTPPVCTLDHHPRFNMTLDYENTIFQALFGLTAEYVEDVFSDNTIRYQESAETPRFPIFFHGNGNDPSKALLRLVWDRALEQYDAVLPLTEQLTRTWNMRHGFESVNFTRNCESQLDEIRQIVQLRSERETG